MPERTTFRNSPLRQMEWLVAGALWAWFVVATPLVRLEYYDGMDSILNARYFTGQIAEYTATRGPLVGLLLTPAEWIRQAFSLHPLEFRPHHVLMALIHAAFLFGSYALLARRFGRTPATLFAFIAAVPTYIVFSYLPFVSHDLFPGVLLLAMVVMTRTWCEQRSAAAWSILVALGAAAALTKHIYGLFWIAILLAFLPRLRERPAWGPFAGLVLAALASGAITWLVLCACLGEVFPDVPWWRRALEQLHYLSGPAHDQSRAEPWWVYLRNLPAFGLTAVLLVPAGLWFSLRGDPDQRLAARVWLILLVAMHLVALRQVRYLAFLGPLTAFLIIPAVEHLRRRTFLLAAAALLLALEFLPVHGYSRMTEALRFVATFYREDAIRQFLAPAERSPGRLRTPVYINWNMLSFTPPWPTPLAGDIYHQLFHVGNHHLFHLYGLKPGEMVMLDDQHLAQLDVRTAQGALIHASGGILIHRTRWGERGTDNASSLMQAVIPLPVAERSP